MTREEYRPVKPERVAALQGTQWVLSFFQNHPRLATLQAGDEDKFLQGGFDVHVHANPDTLGPRSQSLIDVAADASRAGMRAVLHKDHHHSTVGVAEMAQRCIDNMVETGQLPHRVEVYGGVPLSFSTDPRSVEVTLRSPHMRMIFFNCLYGEPLTEGTKVKQPVLDVIKLAADHRVPITLCPPNHSTKQSEPDFEGTLPLVEAITAAGAKGLLDHPVSCFTVEQAKRLVDYGMYCGVFCFPTLPTVAKAPVVDPDLVREMVLAIGPERCVIGSDMGHILEPDAIPAIRMLIRLLLAYGLTDRQLTAMCQTNPAALLFG